MVKRTLPYSSSCTCEVEATDETAPGPALLLQENTSLPAAPSTPSSLLHRFAAPFEGTSPYLVTEMSLKNCFEVKKQLLGETAHS